jgi:hypothetical protein
MWAGGLNRGGMANHSRSSCRLGAGVQTCFIPWKGHAGHIYAGKWGIFGNDGHPQDDGDQKYDLDISWLDFGTCLGYPKQMLLFGEFVKGFPSWI